jgi:hypothetical protein
MYKVAKRLSISVAKDTLDLIEQLIDMGICNSTSNLVSIMVRHEAERCGLIEPIKGSTQPTTDSSAVDALSKKVSECIAITKAIDDKAYVLLDCFNSFLQYAEPDSSVEYAPMDVKLNKSNIDNQHEYVKKSNQSLKERKHIEKLGKI